MRRTKNGVTPLHFYTEEEVGLLKDTATLLESKVNDLRQLLKSLPHRGRRERLIFSAILAITGAVEYLKKTLDKS